MTETQQEQVRESSEVNAEPTEEKNTRTDIIRLVLVGIAATFSFVGGGGDFSPLNLVAIVAVLLGGYPVFKETFESLREGHVNMEVSMAVAIFASLFLEQFAVSALITFFVLLSEVH